MEKNSGNYSVGEVSLSPISPIATSPNPNQDYASPPPPQGAYHAIQVNSNQPTVVYAGSFTQNATIGLLPPSNPGPTYGRWRDSICSWPTNLWPSCGCLLIACGGWHVAQSKFPSSDFLIKFSSFTED